jgi:catechol 2,3-dioxygenase-like lactoylglutathione lyase family enzyme
MAIPRMADASAVLAGVLGGVPTPGASRNGFTWGVWRFEGGGDLEILEPHGPDGFVHRFLALRGPGIHHVTFKVPSLGDVCARAEARGYTIVGRDDSDPTWMEAFLHPRQGLGVVVQFAEEHVTPVAVDRPSPAPAGSPPPVRILGLRMRARSRAAARRQWEEVLLGEGESGDGDSLVFRWPGSPMRLAVDVDPGAEEGPIAIEYAAEGDVALPEGPHPVLGARFERR